MKEITSRTVQKFCPATDRLLCSVFYLYTLILDNKYDAFYKDIPNKINGYAVVIRR